MRSRVLERFSTWVSKENVLAKSPPAERLGFLLQLARATEKLSDAASLRWYLQQEFGKVGITGDLRDRVARRLLSGK